MKLLSTATLAATVITSYLVAADVSEVELQHKRALRGKIVGGGDAPVNMYPWFAQATDSDGIPIGCGGTLVSPEFILTAAHCVVGTNLLTGGWNIGAYESPYLQGSNGGQTLEYRTYSNIFSHPDYDSSTLDNDYALMKLSSPITNIEPAAMDHNLYSPNYQESQANLWAIGLGFLEEGWWSPTPSRLQHVELSYVMPSECKKDYLNSIGDTTDNMICAEDPGQDSCQGDSGGPLYDKDNNVLIGIVSWGEGCARPDKPGVYASVAAQWEWIRDTICNNSSNSNPPTFCAVGTTDEDITIYNGIWGDWKSWAILEEDHMYACGAQLRFENSQGSWSDDTAANGLKLKFCDLHNWHDQDDELVWGGNWGGWKDWAMCSDGKYMAGARVRFEGSQAWGDDTALNGLQILCVEPDDWSNSEIKTVYSGLWGDWKPWNSVESKLVKGAQVRYEEPQGGGDDTALNGIRFNVDYPSNY